MHDLKTGNKSEAKINASSGPVRSRMTLARTTRLSLVANVHAIFVILKPVLAILAVWWSVTAFGFHASDLVFWGIAHIIGFVGVSISLHRYFSHASFKCGKTLRAILAVLGMSAAQGSLLFWVASHRHHHARSDRNGDPHSPIAGRRSILQGIWNAHFGWMLSHTFSNPAHFARDLMKDPMIIRLNQMYLFWVLLGLVVPTILGWVMFGAVEGAIRGLIWGGVLRLATVDNVTFLVNSLGHSFGTRRFETNDNSRNLWWLSLMSLGDSWHNNHHAHPGSARMGFGFRQPDISYLIIRLFRQVGLIHSVKTATTNKPRTSAKLNRKRSKT